MQPLPPPPSKNPGREEGWFVVALLHLPLYIPLAPRPISRRFKSFYIIHVKHSYLWMSMGIWVKEKVTNGPNT